MADTTTPTPANAAVDFSETLKPVASWKTATTKALSVLGMIGGTVETVIGVAQIVRGNGIGVANMASGLIGGGASKLAWDSASGATRARNFVEIQKQLNAQAAVGRA